jgi:hypothetical protein
MELYIRIVDGQPFEHPILGDNFREAFPHVDADNIHLYEEYARFERITQIDAGVFPNLYQRVECTYTKRDDGVWQDTWTIVDFTPEEKEAKIEHFMIETPKPFESWHFEESTCTWEAPIPHPELQDGVYWRWNESIVNWEQYTPDFITT